MRYQFKHPKVKGIYWVETGDGGYWQIDKTFRGKRTWRIVWGDEDAATKAWLEEKERIILGVAGRIRPDYPFLEACKIYISAHCKHSCLKAHTRELSILCDDFNLSKQPVRCINYASVKPYISARKQAGVKNRTINHGIQAVNGVLRMCAKELVDKQTDMTWLATYEPIRALSAKVDKRLPRPIETWDIQDRIIAEIPPHKRDQVLYILNTGARCGEVRRLKWEWEQKTPWGSSIFVIPPYINMEARKEEESQVKSGRWRVIAHNAISQEIIDAQRGKHAEYVFTYNGEHLDRPNSRIGSSSWYRSRTRKKYDVRIHDLRHTTATRMASCEVPEHTRADILDHEHENMAQVYAATDIQRLEAGLATLEKRVEVFLIQRSA